MLKKLKSLFSSKKQNTESEYPDEHQMLEQLGYLFLNKEMNVSAAGLFSTLVKNKPDSTMGWYGIANSLYRISLIEKDLNKLKIGVQCVLRSIDEDENNEFAKELHQWMITRTPLKDKSTSNILRFNGDSKIITELIGFNGKILISDFQNIESWEERMQIIMFLENNKEEYAGDLYLHALDDPNNDVKMAALKRIGFWGNKNEVRDILVEMVESKAWDDVGHYLGMAINRVKIYYPEYEEWAEPLLKIVYKATEIT
jgi:hypothetical protein